MDSDDDEPVPEPKLPLQQLTILGICRFAEPLASTSLTPYLPEMIRSFNVPDDSVGVWVGVVTAAFSISQALMGIPWGRASDIYGRKPAILLGLTTTLITSLIWGFSTSLPVAIFARALAGAGNGNVGIIRTVVAELVPYKELQPRAFSLMPLVWNIGSIFGPSLGGALANPLHVKPGARDDTDTLLQRYPYALPNIVSAIFFLISIITGLLFLEETLETKKNQRDYGLVLGRESIRQIKTGYKCLVACIATGYIQLLLSVKAGFTRLKAQVKSASNQLKTQSKRAYEHLRSKFRPPSEDDEVFQPLIYPPWFYEPPAWFYRPPPVASHADDDPPESLLFERSEETDSSSIEIQAHSGYAAGNPSQDRRIQSEQADQGSSDVEQQLSPEQLTNAAPPGWKDVLTRQSLLNLLAYFFIATHTMTYDVVLPVFYSRSSASNTSDFSTSMNNPLQFFGNLGLTAFEIGILNTCYGVLGMVIQFFIFPAAARKLGVLYCLKWCSIIFPTCYFLTPFTYLLPNQWSRVAACFAIQLVKGAASIFCFPCAVILLSNSAATPRVLGTLNGCATLVSATGRALGPLTVGALYWEGQKSGYLVAPWWFLSLIALVGALPVFALVEGDGFASGRHSWGPVYVPPPVVDDFQPTQEPGCEQLRDLQIKWKGKKAKHVIIGDGQQSLPRPMLDVIEGESKEELILRIQRRKYARLHAYASIS